jgi:hypothetical protein
MCVRAIPRHDHLVSDKRAETLRDRNSRMKLSVISHAGILRMVPYLSLALITAQTDDNNSNQEPPVTPAVQETKVPHTAEDKTCGSGLRNVIDIFQDDILVSTEEGQCVPKKKK